MTSNEGGKKNLLNAYEVNMASTLASLQTNSSLSTTTTTITKTDTTTGGAGAERSNYTFVSPQKSSILKKLPEVKGLAPRPPSSTSPSPSPRQSRSPSTTSTPPSSPSKKEKKEKVTLSSTEKVKESGQAIFLHEVEHADSKTHETFLNIQNCDAMGIFLTSHMRYISGERIYSIIDAIRWILGLFNRTDSNRLQAERLYKLLKADEPWIKTNEIRRSFLYGCAITSPCLVMADILRVLLLLKKDGNTKLQNIQAHIHKILNGLDLSNHEALGYGFPAWVISKEERLQKQPVISPPITVKGAKSKNSAQLTKESLPSSSSSSLALTLRKVNFMDNEGININNIIPETDPNYKRGVKRSRDDKNGNNGKHDDSNSSSSDDNSDTDSSSSDDDDKAKSVKNGGKSKQSIKHPLRKKAKVSTTKPNNIPTQTKLPYGKNANLGVWKGEILSKMTSFLRDIEDSRDLENIMLSLGVKDQVNRKEEEEKEEEDTLKNRYRLQDVISFAVGHFAVPVNAKETENVIYFTKLLKKRHCYWAKKNVIASVRNQSAQVLWADALGIFALLPAHWDMYKFVMQLEDVVESGGVPSVHDWHINAHDSDYHHLRIDEFTRKGKKVTGKNTGGGAASSIVETLSKESLPKEKSKDMDIEMKIESTTKEEEEEKKGKPEIPRSSSKNTNDNSSPVVKSKEEIPSTIQKPFKLAQIARKSSVRPTEEKKVDKEQKPKKKKIVKKPISLLSDEAINQLENLITASRLAKEFIAELAPENKAGHLVKEEMIVAIMKRLTDLLR